MNGIHIPLASNLVIAAGASAQLDVSCKVLNRLLFQEDSVGLDYLLITINIGPHVLCNEIRAEELKNLNRYFDGGNEVVAHGTFFDFVCGNIYLSTNQEVNITIENTHGSTGTLLDVLAIIDNFLDPNPKILEKINDGNFSRSNVKRAMLIDQRMASADLDERTDQITVQTDTNTMISQAKNFFMVTACDAVNYVLSNDFAMVVESEFMTNLTVNHPSKLSGDRWLIQSTIPDLDFIRKQKVLQAQYLKAEFASIPVKALQLASTIRA